MMLLKWMFLASFFQPRRLFRLLAVFGLAAASVPAAWANNLSMTSPGLGTSNTTAHTRDIQFTISWDNSWCDTGAACNGDAQTQTANWDAAWVFAKFSKWNSTTSTWSDWAHCTLVRDNGSNTPPTGSKVDMGCNRPGSGSVDCSQSDAVGKGAFVYRNAHNTDAAPYTFTATNVKLKWQYGGTGGDGVSDTDVVKVKVFGIEMVYVPAGNFWAGDGSVTNVYANFQYVSSSIGPVQITSATSAAINASTTNNNTSWNDDSKMNGGAGITITGASGIACADGSSCIGYTTMSTSNTSFPTGYNAFYIMKYELSQGQYRDFLNTLTRPQQANRVASSVGVGITSLTNIYVMSNTSSVSYRNGIVAPSSLPSTSAITFSCNLSGDGVASTSGEWVAMNWLSWMDDMAFADWAGLRPFTELEFEKAARGPQAAVADEYAWGSTSITNTTGPSSSGTTSEVSSTAGSNCNYSGGIAGPIRSGAFAKTGSTRVQSGAGYYGGMELSGNLWERPVTVGNAKGRAFTGLHGDGVLDASGYANVNYWPGQSGSDGTSGIISGATGSGFRGGSWSIDTSSARVSARSYAANGYGGRINDYGARLARTSP